MTAPAKAQSGNRGGGHIQVRVCVPVLSGCDETRAQVCTMLWPTGPPAADSQTTSPSTKLIRLTASARAVDNSKQRLHAQRGAHRDLFAKGRNAPAAAHAARSQFSRTARTHETMPQQCSSGQTAGPPTRCQTDLLAKPWSNLQKGPFRQHPHGQKRPVNLLERPLETGQKS